jgi:hypothetical protein
MLIIDKFAKSQINQIFSLKFLVRYFFLCSDRLTNHANHRGKLWIMHLEC